MSGTRKGKPVQARDLMAEEIEKLARRRETRAKGKPPLRARHSAPQSDFEQTIADRMLECCLDELQDKELAELCETWGERYATQFEGLEWGNGGYCAIADIEKRADYD